MHSTRVPCYNLSLSFLYLTQSLSSADIERGATKVNQYNHGDASIDIPFVVFLPLCNTLQTFLLPTVKMTIKICPFLMVFLSSIMTQGRLVPSRDPSCELDAIEFVPLLSNYRPALDYCSSTFPITHSSVATIFTTTVIVPPNGIITLSGDVDGGTQTISGPTSTVFITSTVTVSSLVSTAQGLSDRG